MFTGRRPASPLPPYTLALCRPTSYMPCSPLTSRTPTLASIDGWRTGSDAETRSPDSGLGGRKPTQGKETQRKPFTPEAPTP